MAVPIGSITQISFLYTCADQRLLNVTHWVNQAEVSLTVPDFLAAVANYVGDAAAADSPASHIINVLPGNVALTSVRAQLIRDTRWAYKQKLVGEPGEQADTPTPNLDVVVTKRAVSSGRSEVGAFFLPGVPEDQMANGLIDGLYQASVAAEMSWLADPLTWSGGEPDLLPIILHPLGAIEPYSRIYDLIVQPEVRDMTRRRVGRGQ